MTAMPRFSLLLGLLVIFTLTSCSNTPQTVKPAIQHIVVVWLKEPGNEQHRLQLLKASQRLTEIPGILSVQGGKVIGSERSVVDSSFDIVLVMRIRNREVLNNYVQHPLHQQLLNEVFKPLIERYRVYDVEEP